MRFRSGRRWCCPPVVLRNRTCLERPSCSPAMAGAAGRGRDGGGGGAVAGRRARAAVACRSATAADAGLRQVVPAVTRAAGPRRPPVSGDRTSPPRKGNLAPAWASPYRGRRTRGRSRRGSETMSFLHLRRDPANVTSGPAPPLPSCTRTVQAAPHAATPGNAPVYAAGTARRAVNPCPRLVAGSHGQPPGAAALAARLSRAVHGSSAGHARAEQCDRDEDGECGDGLDD